MTQPSHQPRPGVRRHDLLQTEPVTAPVLVVVFLRGGADGLTLVPPVADDAYHRARPLLAVDTADAIDVDGYFALNPALGAMSKYLERGELAIVHGAGSEDGSRSHFEAQDTMEHGGAMAGSGWLARYLRAADPSPSALSAVAIGTTRPESLRGAPGAAVMQTIRDFGLEDADAAFLADLERLYARDVGVPGLAPAARATIEAVGRLRALRATPGEPQHGAVYPEGEFGRGLREIARLIRADIGLAATTIDLGGWDTHFVQSRVIGGLMRELAGGVDAFLTDLGEAHRRVTVVVMTEFGRRLRENTSFGTDHGAGSAMMILGAGAATASPGKVISAWRDLSDASLDDVGDVPASINYRDVLAPVLRLHAPGVDLGAVFPGYVLHAS